MVKTEREEIKPVCPFCEIALEKLVEVKSGWFARNRVYCCPHCRKIVGVGVLGG
ncbi:MAG: hypothetical protein ACE5HV_15645 [Acidobacteriota bacterium]